MRYVSSPGDASDSVDPAEIRACLGQFPVEIAVLFGSTATGDDTALSDVDVGVILDSTVHTDRGRILDRIRAALIDTTGRDAIDLVDLDAVGPNLRYDALATGILLLGDERTVTDRTATSLVRMLDFKPVRRRWQRALDRRIAEGTYGRP